MVDTTDIEKKSLEAHVELCAERYRYLEEKLQTVEYSTTQVNSKVTEIHNMMHDTNKKRQDQLLSWGVGIIAALTSAVAFLLVQYVFK